MSVGPFHDELSSLRQEVDARYAAWKEVRLRQERDFHTAAREVTADLVTHRDAITFAKPDAVPPAERPEAERRLTREFCQAVQERGLTIHAAGNGGAVTIVDPSIDADFEVANAALTEARQAVERFEREHADGLKAETDRAEMDRIRGALDGDDPAAVREALEGTRELAA